MPPGNWYENYNSPSQFSRSCCFIGENGSQSHATVSLISVLWLYTSRLAKVRFLWLLIIRQNFSWPINSVQNDMTRESSMVHIQTHSNIHLLIHCSPTKHQKSRTIFYLTNSTLLSQNKSGEFMPPKGMDTNILLRGEEYIVLQNLFSKIPSFQKLYSKFVPSKRGEQSVSSPLSHN